MVCDINGLKAVNDLHGHKEGDACIKGACEKVCRIFSHSPVFRVGGDEFAVISQGMDYDAIEDLKVKIGIKPTIRDYVPDEADFLNRLDEMCVMAFDDQCTGANPRYPLISELRQMFLNAYYGKKCVENKTPNAQSPN